MKTLNPYLAWIGTEFYPDFESFADEAGELGVSKRVPNLAVGKALTEPGTVVFLAHDEGEKGYCPDCSVERACPHCDGVGSYEPKAKGELPVAWRVDCRHCDGTGRVTVGTGGQAIVDGQSMDYRELWARKKHPKAHPELEGAKVEMHRCETCGGFGTVPLGQIHGLFVPQGLEYILRAGDDDKVKADIEKAGATTVTMLEVDGERKRGCGYRKPGGTYLITKTTGRSPADVKRAVEELIEKGLISPEGVEVKGAFARFVTPIPILGVKRFRGLKRWSMDPRVEMEADMILEAM